MDHSSDTSQQPSATPTPVAGAVVSQRRRRFIQAGVVPVTLTLASRPVMAWHCNTTSAWGSAVLRNGGASVQARLANSDIENTECWYITDWMRNTTRPQVRASATPWSCVSKKWYGSKKSDKQAQDALTVYTLFPGGLWGTNSKDNVFKVLQKGSMDFGAMMLAARLNMLVLGAPVSNCMLSNKIDQLPLIAMNGPDTYRPPNSTGAAWSTADINKYLTANWLI